MDDKEELKEIFGRYSKYTRDPVSHDEIEKILFSCDYNLRGMILIQSSSGMRIGELLGLKVKDVTKKRDIKSRFEPIIQRQNQKE